MLLPVDWQPDYDALVTNGGSISLADWTQVQLTGSDRATFLRNMCTNDIRRLEAGQTCEAFCTNVKGKIVAHVLVIVQDDSLILLTVPEQGSQLITHLDRYVIREDVQLTHISGGPAWHYFVGPLVPPPADAYQCSLLWPGGYLLPAEVTSKTPPPDPTIPAASPAFTALRVESFWPLFGIDFDESYLPQEINRDSQAISFNKGCYLGQETVARIDALGHVNKKIAVVKFAGEQIPEVGSKLTKDGADVGTITSSCWSPQFQAPAAIATIRRGANEVGAELENSTGERATIVPPVAAGKS